MNYLHSSRLRGNNAATYEQIEKDELQKQRKFQSGKRLSSQKNPDINILKQQSIQKKETPLNFHLNRENLQKLEQQSLANLDIEDTNQSEYRAPSLIKENLDINDQFQTPNKASRKQSSKGINTSFGKSKIHYGISAFKDGGNMSLTVSKTDIYGSKRDVSPVIHYGLDQVIENDEIELKVADASNLPSANKSMRPSKKGVENIKIPPRENIRVVKILSGPGDKRKDFSSVNTLQESKIQKLKAKLDQDSLPDLS
jgi:hypothetical protein